MPARCRSNCSSRWDYGIAERIRELNLDELRPIEALQLLAELQGELKRQ